MELKEKTIYTFSEIEPEKIVSFNKEVYPNNDSLNFDQISWRFRVGFDKEIEPLYLVSDGKILGQAGLTPCIYLIDNQEKNATWFNSLIISPNMQGKGLGKILTENWMKIAPVHITNCNDNSMAIFRKMGWKENFDTVRYALPINLVGTARNKNWKGLKLFATQLLNPFYSFQLRLKYRNSNDLKMVKINNFNATELMNFFFHESENCLLKDESWFQWRFYSCPFSKEYSLATFKDAACIIRILTFNGVKRLHLVYQTSESDNNSLLVRAIIKYAIENKIDFVWAITNVLELKKCYESFLTNQLETRFAFHADDEKDFTSLGYNQIPLQAADSDYDIMFF